VLRYQVTAVAATATSGNPAMAITWAADHTLKQAYFPPARARYVRLEATSTAGGAGAIASEIDTGELNRPPCRRMPGRGTAEQHSSHPLRYHIYGTLMACVRP
jgi:hypothetical protein